MTSKPSLAAFLAVALAAGSASADPPSSAGAGPRAVEAAAPAPPGPDGTVRVIAFGTTALGAIGLGVGVTAGIVALSKKGQASSHCDPQNLCDPTGLALERQGAAAGDVSTAFLVASSALLVTGVSLLVFAPKPGPRAASAAPASAPAAVRLAVGPSRLALTGTF
ncbi:MAG TPA: hypothetical protein VHB21_00185 [Minicystis sp.]|nr:hypothetical protein [Minicystis sp.]